MKARFLIRQRVARKDRERLGKEWFEVGDVIEHPDAWKLVRIGSCEPADEACDKRANVGPESAKQRQAAYAMANAGIAQEDVAAYKDGLMVGYNDDQSWKPGPNYTEGCEEAYYEQQEDDDDE